MRCAYLFVATGVTLLAASCAKAQFLYPESCEYDAVRERWLVSNQGYNVITTIESDGRQTIFSALTTPRGLAVSGDTLFAVSASLGLAAYNLSTGQRYFLRAFSGMVELNDVAVDSSGNAYVSDWQGHKIYRLHLSDMSSTMIATNLTLVNGLMYDHPNNRLLFCQWTDNSPISAVNLTDYSVSVAINLSLDQLDGITQDNEGSIYFSAHGSGAVYRLPADLSGSPEMVVSGLTNPADIFYNKYNDTLAVPEVYAHRVSFFRLYDGDGDGIFAYLDNCPEMANPGQADADSDGLGDVCDLCTDIDGDGFGDPGFPANTCVIDNCPELSNPDQVDEDDDGVGHFCDNCLLTPNPDQLDGNGDCPAPPYTTDPKCGDACLGCCLGRVGDANMQGPYPNEITLGDVSLLIDVKFISGDCGKLTCLQEADVNQNGGGAPNCQQHVTLADISMLIDFLFITGPATAVLPACL